MDVSAEAADVVVRESIQATEAAAKLTLEGVKNVAALLLAIAKQDMKVVGETTAKRLARDPLWNRWAIPFPKRPRRKKRQKKRSPALHKRNPRQSAGVA